MGRETVRASYRRRRALLVIPGLLLAAVVLPFGAFFVDAAPWWPEVLFILLAIGMCGAWVLRRVVYRMDLTDSALILRAPLGRTRVPFGELARIGGPLGRYEVVRRDGRVWQFVVDDGLAEFLDEVSRRAPDAKIEVGGLDRASG